MSCRRYTFRDEIDEWACSTYGERRGVYRVVVGKPKGKRPLARPRHRWKNNIKLDLQEAGIGGAWAGLMWLRVGTSGGHL